MGEEKDHKPEIIMHYNATKIIMHYNATKIIMHYNATKSGADVLDKLVREYTCTRPTRHWHLKFLPQLD